MDSQLHKALSLGASLVLAASPGYAQTIPPAASGAQIYGNITGSNGAVKAGSVGITSVTKVSNTSGHYCILPSSQTLRSDLTYDVNNATGFVDVQLTQSSTSWPAVGKYVVQVTGANVTKFCSSDEVAVSIMQLTGCVAPTNPTNTSAASCYDGYQSENSDFTIFFE